ncbi:MAG: hypothetical protein C0393_00525 [Anaerolinea sp.]|nr:hypothetical protein [Anaerolinea sp.]
MARVRRKKSSALDELKRKIQSDKFYKENQITFIDTPGKKLSAVLLEFIAPYNDPSYNKQAYDKLITMAVIAWNAAILEGKERKQFVNKAIASILEITGEEWRKDAENILAMMIKRKEQFFADDKRFVVEYSWSETKSHRHLAVSTSLKSADSLSELLQGLKTDTNDPANIRP